jgi:hypothetical protein
VDVVRVNPIQAYAGEVGAEDHPEIYKHGD